MKSSLGHEIYTRLLRLIVEKDRITDRLTMIREIEKELQALQDTVLKGEK